MAGIAYCSGGIHSCRRCPRGVKLIKEFDEKTTHFSQQQKELWERLGKELPEWFVLYGDTALGARLGHDSSPNFEFKTARNFNAHLLREIVPFLRNAEICESRWNHLEAKVGGISITFDGGQTMAQINPPERARNGSFVASLDDLAGEKMHRIGQRMSERDCYDVAALIYEGMPLNHMAGFAKAQFGQSFDRLNCLMNLMNVDRRSGIDLDRETESLLIREASGAVETGVPARTPVNCKEISTKDVELAAPPRRKENYEREIDPFELSR